jgi:hypothetical protein
MATLECPKCGELHQVRGFWHPDLPRPICSSCLGLEDEAEEASFREKWNDEDEEDNQ